MVWVLDREGTEVAFTAQHLMVSTVHGHFTDFAADVSLDPEHPERSHVAARIAAASIETGNEERDAHIRSADFLDVDRYPSIEFSSSQVAQVGPDSFWLRGDLSLHGVTREVTLRGRFDTPVHGLAVASAAHFELAAEVDREDFGLASRGAIEAAGILVGRTVTITIRAVVRRPAPTAPESTPSTPPAPRPAE